MEIQTAAHVKTRCSADFAFAVSRRLSGTYVSDTPISFTDGNERAVTDVTGTEKEQEGVSKTKKCKPSAQI